MKPKRKLLTKILLILASAAILVSSILPIIYWSTR